jgi:hypothetical protein
VLLLKTQKESKTSNRQPKYWQARSLEREAMMKDAREMKRKMVLMLK